MADMPVQAGSHAAAAVVPLAPEALDFAPDLLAIQERPPSRMPRALSVTIVALVGLLLLWTIFFKLDIIASAEGRLVPLTFTKVVQPAEAGVVTEILVDDGQAVKEGQLLMRLDARMSQADTAALGKDVALRRLTLRRIDADPSNPRRQDYLARFADREGREFLARFYRKYAGKPAHEAEDLLVHSARPTPARLAAAFYGLEPDANADPLAEFIARRLPNADLSNAALQTLRDKVGPDRWSLADRGYLAACTRWNCGLRPTCANIPRPRSARRSRPAARTAGADTLVRERARRIGRLARGAGRADGHHRQPRHAPAGDARRLAAVRAGHETRLVYQPTQAERVLKPEIAARAHWRGRRGNSQAAEGCADTSRMAAWWRSVARRARATTASTPSGAAANCSLRAW